MKDELRKKLSEYFVSQNLPDNDESVMEVLSYGDAVKEYGHDEHRWYTMYSKIVKVGDFFVDFETYTNSGDEPAFDGNEHFEMVRDSAVEVFPVPVMTTDYVTADKLEEKASDAN